MRDSQGRGAPPIQLADPALHPAPGFLGRAEDTCAEVPIHLGLCPSSTGQEAPHLQPPQVQGYASLMGSPVSGS